MATIGNIVIKDGADLDHTFAPVGRNPSSEMVNYRENGASVAQSNTLSTLITSKPSVDRVTGKITLPVYDTPTDGSTPSLQFTLVGSFDLSLPNIASETQRENCRTLLANLLLNAQIAAMADKGEHQVA